MSWPFVALLSLSTFWLGLFILLNKWPRVANNSISQHSAAQLNSYIFFTAIQVSVGIITYLFMVKWFIPSFELPIFYTIFYTVVAWLQIISAFLPATSKGLVGSIHLVMANLFALGMMISAMLLSIFGTYSLSARMLFIGTLIYMLYAASRIAGKKGRPELLHNYLLLQVIYIVSFQISILFASFLG
jgi:hypothetical protein